MLVCDSTFVYIFQCLHADLIMAAPVVQYVCKWTQSKALMDTKDRHLKQTARTPRL